MPHLCFQYQYLATLFYKMITLDFSGIQLKLKQQDGKPVVWDPVRKFWYILTPEEHVRQYLLRYMLDVAAYPAGMLAVEKQIKVGNLSKRFDIVVYDRSHKPWMLVECKAPEIIISESTLHQLLNYQRSMQCNYWVLSNGHQCFCADACDVQQIKWMDSLPPYEF